MNYLLIILALIIAFFLFKKKKTSIPKSATGKVADKNNGLESEWNRWKTTFDPANCCEIQRTFNAKIIGVTYKNKDGSNRQSIISKCRFNEKLLLIPEKYKGDWAISVCRENFEQLGYLSADLAYEISDLMVRRKSRVDAKISSLTGGNGKTKGANIEIIKFVINNRPARVKKEKVEEKPYDPSIKMHRLSYQRNIQASELEKNGYIENAIELYKSIVDNKKLEMNDASMPFSRLTIIYRKRKDYDKEIEIIEKWKQMYATSSLNEESEMRQLASLDKRLEKAKSLRERKK
jgi:tetratricopeptide (TPR) repeat protein